MSAKSRALKAYLSSHPDIKQKRIEQIRRLQPLAVEKAREKTLGQPLSEEHKRRIREAKLKSGYHHSEETRRKIGEKGEGRIPWNKGKKCPQISKKLKGRSKRFRGKKNPNLARYGEKNPFYGRHHSDATKEKLRQKILSKIHESPEYLQKLIRNTKVDHHPTKPERDLIELIRKHSLPFKFVGDGKVIIHGKCPDFINNNGGKQVIEVFGDYWHKPEEEQERMAAFAEYGFETLIIWEHELENPSEVLAKVETFIGGI